MHKVFGVPLFLTSFACLACALFVFHKNRFSQINRLFSFLSSAVSLWCFGYGMVYVSATPQKCLYWARIAFIGVAFIPTFTYHFVTVFLNIARRRTLIIFYAVSSSFLLIIRSAMFFDGTYIYYWGYYPKAGPIYGVFITFFYFCFALCVYNLARIYIELKKKSDHLILQNQVKYVFLSFCVASASFSDYLPNYHVQIYPFAYLAATGWLALMAYGTLKYRVMDINLIIRKTLVYSAVMVVLTALYLLIVTITTKLFQGLTGYQTILSSSFAAGLITLCFQPLRKRVQAFVDAKFFRQFVDREEKLYELSREVVTHTTPEAMARALMRVLGETLHPKTGTLYLRSRDGSGYLPMAVCGESTPDRMPEENPLVRYFADHPQPFVQEVPEDLGVIKDTRNVPHKDRNAA